MGAPAVSVIRTFAALVSPCAAAFLYVSPTMSQGIDPCLIGSWEAVSSRNFGSSSAGGSGFRVTFKGDGTETIDYSAMVPFQAGTDTIVFSGEASGRIKASPQDKTAYIEEVTSSTVKLTINTVASPAPVVWDLSMFLGPGALGGTTDNNTYVCDEEFLSYQGSLHRDRHANFPVKLKRLGAPLTVRFTDRDFKPLSEVVLTVIRPAGIGTGEVWVEVEAGKDDSSFDDNVIDTVSVSVTSDVDPRGDTVDCVETAEGSRLFRSTRPVLLQPAASEVTP